LLSSLTPLTEVVSGGRMSNSEVPESKFKPIFAAIAASLCACAIAVPAFALPTAPVSGLRVAHVSFVSAAKYNRRAPLAGAQIAQEGDESEPDYGEAQGLPHHWRGYEVQPYYSNGEEASHVRHEREEQEIRNHSNQDEETQEHAAGAMHGTNPGADQGYAPDSD
jgi:hypothetical protein